MSNSEPNEAGTSCTIQTNSLATGPQVFRVIRERRVGLRNLLRDMGFRQRDPDAQPPHIGEYNKHQIETSRNEVAIATFTASGMEDVHNVDYLFQIVHAGTHEPIRTYTPDFTPLRNRTYTWEFDGRDYLSRIGRRPFAEDGLYIGRIQLRSNEQISSILFERPIRVVSRAARLLAMDGNNGDAGLVFTGRLTSIDTRVPVSNIFEQIIRSSDATIVFSRASTTNFRGTQAVFRTARINTDSTQLLFYFGFADPSGRLKAVAGTTAEGLVLFDPLSDRHHLQWNNVRWLILMAPYCLALNHVKWRTSAETRQIVPTSGHSGIPGATRLLTVFHPGIHWFNAIRNTGLRGILGYWGPVSPDIDEPDIQWTLRMFVTRLEQGQPFITAWRAANSAASISWAAFVRDNATEDSLEQMASGLSVSRSEWRYWDRFHENEDPASVYNDLSRYSSSYRAGVTPEFDPRYDMEALHQGIPDNFDIYNDGIEF